MKKILVCSILLLTSLIAFCAPVGTWKNYLSYHTTTEIEHVGDIYYVLASGGLYSYNAKDGSIYTYDKTNGLSDTGIKAIQWNKSSRKLVIVYKDNNIDLLSENGKIENLPDYYLKAMTEDKTIHSIYNNGVFAYLSTAFGILKVNTKNAEFSDTYFLNESVEYAYIANNQLYAAIPTKGLMACSLASNPQNKSNWSVVGAYVAPNKQLNASDLAVINKVKPNGAQYNSFAFMTLKGNTLYTAPGGFNSVIDASTPGAVQVYDGQKWTMYEDDLTTKTPN
ncbi:MAG: Por secretion system protein, partial [Prevotella nanceiensis]|nr:Por secretion system protein [Hoylesella nanceiensis]